MQEKATPSTRSGGGNAKGTRRRFGTVRRLPSGRFQARYTGPDGLAHRATTTFDTKGDADAWLALESAKVTRHEWAPLPQPKPMATVTFAEYSVAWLRDRQLTARTRSEYTRLVSDLNLELGDRVLARLTPADLQRWYRAQSPGTPTARAHRVALLRSILASAVEDEDVPLAVSPARMIKGTVRARRQHVVKPATPEEIQLIADHMPEKYRLMVHLAAWCALRYGELAELRRTDIGMPRDMESDGLAVIHVRRGVTWPKGSGPTVGLPKTDAGVRFVSIPPHLLRTLRDHLDTHAQPGQDGLLFPNTNGQHLHHGSLYKVYKPARRAAGRPDLRWHDLRHTGATMVAQEGATLAELMARLGHSTVSAALIYQHASTERDQDLARRLSARAMGKRAE